MTNKLGSQFRKRYQDFEKWRRYANSRKQAHALRKEVIRRKGKSFVDNRLIDKIKTYAKQEFGTSGYWPWLALYAEMREDFIEGWIPDDFNSRYNYVIQPSVRQHESINRLYGRSVNTIRVITYLADDGSVSIIFKAMRFGVNGLRIDNVNHGGWFFLLDEHGRAATNAYDALGFDAGENHPDTGFRYKDMAVPSFEQAVEKCKDSHRLFPYVGLIAWDVFIDENGIPGLIEWNAKCPGIWGNEALFGPLMLAFQNLKIGS